MDLKKLPQDVCSFLRSGLTITNTARCVTELVANSLDAGSTSIAVRVDFRTFKIEVVDNGHGINKKNLDLIGNRYMTSKCHSLSELQGKLDKYGFRGEAIASLCELSSLLTISSRVKCSSDTYSKVFCCGTSTSAGLTTKRRPAHGTTVTIQDFLYSMPVRRKRIKESIEIEDIKTELECFSVIHPHVSFSLRNDASGALLLQTRKSANAVEAFRNLYGSKVANCLQPIEFSKGSMQINGYIGTEVHTQKNLQFIYINNRLIVKTKLHKLVNMILNKSFLLKSNGPGMNLPIPRDMNEKFGIPMSKKSQYGIFVLNLKCPYVDYDITLDPRKTVIQFRNGSEVLKCVEDCVKLFLQREHLTVPMLTMQSKDPDLEEEQDREILDSVDGAATRRKHPSPLLNIARAVHGLPAKRQKQSKPQAASTTQAHNSSDDSSISGSDEILSTSQRNLMPTKQSDKVSDYGTDTKKLSSRNELSSNAVVESFLNHTTKVYGQNKQQKREEKIKTLFEVEIQEFLKKNLAEHLFRNKSSCDTIESGASVSADIPSTSMSAAVEHVPQSPGIVHKRKQNMERQKQVDQPESPATRMTQSYDTSDDSSSSGGEELLPKSLRHLMEGEHSSTAVDCKDPSGTCDELYRSFSNAMEKSFLQHLNKICSKNEVTKQRKLYSFLDVEFQEFLKRKLAQYLPLHKSSVEAGAPVPSSSISTAAKEHVPQSSDLNPHSSVPKQDYAESCEQTIETTKNINPGPNDQPNTSYQIYMPSFPIQNESGPQEYSHSCHAMHNFAGNVPIIQSNAQSSSLQVYHAQPAQTYTHKLMQLPYPHDKNVQVSDHSAQCTLPQSVQCYQSSAPGHIHKYTDQNDECEANVPFIRYNTQPSSSHTVQRQQLDPSLVQTHSYPTETVQNYPTSHQLRTYSKDQVYSFGAEGIGNYEQHGKLYSGYTYQSTSKRNNIEINTNNSLQTNQNYVRIPQIQNYESSDQIHQSHIKNQNYSECFQQHLSNNSPQRAMKQSSLLVEDTDTEDSTCDAYYTNTSTEKYLKEKSPSTSSDDSLSDKHFKKQKAKLTAPLENLSRIINATRYSLITESPVTTSEHVKRILKTQKSSPHKFKSLATVDSVHEFKSLTQSENSRRFKSKLHEYKLKGKARYKPSFVNQDKQSEVAVSGINYLERLNQSTREDMPFSRDEALIAKRHKLAATDQSSITSCVPYNRDIISIDSPNNYTSLPQSGEVISFKNQQVENLFRYEDMQTSSCEPELQDEGTSFLSNISVETEVLSNTSVETEVLPPSVTMHQLPSSRSNISSVTCDNSALGTSFMSTEDVSSNKSQSSSFINLIPLSLGDTQDTLDSTQQVWSFQFDSSVPSSEHNLNENFPMGGFSIIPEQEQKSDHPLPGVTTNEWQERMDPSGRKYYMNLHSGVTTYESPKEEQEVYSVSSRHAFMPKGSSPVLQIPSGSPGPDAPVLNPEQQAQLQAAVEKSYALEQQLAVVKWTKGQKEIEEIHEVDENLISKICDDNTEVFKKGYNVVSQYKFTKDMLSSVEVLGQWDNKFILTVINMPNEKVPHLLVLFDQHAVHERVRLERLTAEYQVSPKSSKFSAHEIHPPLSLKLNERNVCIILSFPDQFTRLGLVYKVLNSTKIIVTRVPTCLKMREERQKGSAKDNCLQDLVVNLISEQVEAVLKSRGVGYNIPPTLQSVLNSEACTGAVKFGDKLSTENCRVLLACLSQCKMPFQCAHGRPVLTPVFDLKHVDVKQHVKVRKPSLHGVLERLRNKLAKH